MNNIENELNTSEIIYQIIYLIRNKKDYIGAAHLMHENSISIDVLDEKTMKITRLDLAKLADAIIQNIK